METNIQDGTSADAPRLSALHLRLGQIETAFNLIAALAIFALMLLGMWQVVGRQLLKMPMHGYIDYVELSMATFAFMGIAYCQRVNGHVRMDIVVRAARGRTRWIMEFFGTAVGLVVISVLIWYGWTHFMRSYQLGDSTIDVELPIWPSKLLVPVSFGLLWLRLVLELVGYARLIRRPGATPVGVPVALSVEEQAQVEAEGSRAALAREGQD